MSTDISSLSYTTSLNASATTNIIMEKDVDGDDKLSVDEFNISNEDFVKLDINEDNLVSKEELNNSLSSKLLELSKGDITKDDFTEFISSLGIEVSEDIGETLSSDYMTEATSSLLDMLFEESNSEDIGLADFGYLMSVINSQTQDSLTAEQLDSYIENLST